MSHVTKPQKAPCRRVDFRGLWPFFRAGGLASEGKQAIGRDQRKIRPGDIPTPGPPPSASWAALGGAPWCVGGRGGGGGVNRHYGVPENKEG